jgi:hypothetical protein
LRLHTPPQKKKKERKRKSDFPYISVLELAIKFSDANTPISERALPHTLEEECCIEAQKILDRPCWVSPTWSINSHAYVMKSP